LKSIKEISIPPRPVGFRLVYHLYVVFAEDRDGLLHYCLEQGIEAKVHYPFPIYRQPALEYLGYKEGDYPVTDAHTAKIITFPCDQHLEQSELDYIIETVIDYYA
jgi:dTDP-4-amino-4,6-dideoxygalactose transaminase